MTTYLLSSNNETSRNNEILPRFNELLAATPPSEPTIAVTGGNPSNVGSLVRLKCTSNGTPTPIYTWLRDNLPLPALIRYQLNSDNSRLTIDPTDKDDNGKTFTCQVTNGKGSKDEDITLSIQ
ncbi:V-set and immunoglobulin domain-containing protein 2-like, partial [Saccoglossus kowalevskii]